MNGGSYRWSKIFNKIHLTFQTGIIKQNELQLQLQFTERKEILFMYYCISIKKTYDFFKRNFCSQNEDPPPPKKKHLKNINNNKSKNIF